MGALRNLGEVAGRTVDSEVGDGERPNLNGLLEDLGHKNELFHERDHLSIGIHHDLSETFSCILSITS